MLGSQAAWRSPALGTPNELELDAGRVRWFDVGEGPPIVFVHGLLANANLWRKVVARLAPRFRCLTLDLPLGSHELAMGPEADLSPAALAGLLSGAIEAIGVESVTLAGNDTGGALCQIAVTRRPEPIGRLVLTSCDFGDNFPPPGLRFLIDAAATSEGFAQLLEPLRDRELRQAPQAYGAVAKHRLDDEASDSYVLPALDDPAVREDLRRILRGLDTAVAVEAAERLAGFYRPALIAWSRHDPVFPAKDGKALAAALPNSRLEWIEDSYAFSPEDQPDRVADLIAEFVPAAVTT
jgi:pimeloyl-ACP methyl ester carboxylesterase